MPTYTPGELEVMQVLWQHGALKPAGILAELDRPITNPALRSVLRVLLEKGHVNRTKIGKAYHYKSVRPARSALRSMVREVADIFFGGSRAGLIANLVKNEKLSDDEVRELVKIAKGKGK